MAISVSYPYVLQNGTTADATQVMADFYQIQNDVNANAAHNGANSDITSLTGLTTPLSVSQGGTGSSTAAGARTALGLGAAAVEGLGGYIVDSGGNLALSSSTVLPNGTTATTQSASNNSTKVATTAYVDTGLTSPITLANGSTATTQTATDSSTKVATTAFANSGLLKGTITKGSLLTVNPYAHSTANTAHGLGAIPDFLDIRLVCLTSDLGYSPGDSVVVGGSNVNGANAAFAVSCDGTNVYFSGAAAPSITNKGSASSGSITEANWKIVVTPSRIN